VEENRALAPKPPKQRKGGRPWIEIAVCWKEFCGFCGAGLAGRIGREISASFDVLAATARLGGAGPFG